MKTPVKHRFWSRSVTAILGLSFLIPLAAAEARITFKAPIGLGVPGRRVAGGSRSIEPKESQCVQNQNQHVVALVPKSNVVLTTEKNPVLFFYVPQTTAPQLELVVQDKSQKFTKQTYTPSSKGGVIGIPLNKTSLEVGQEYRWFFSIVCNPKERSKDQEVEGVVQRVKIDPQLSAKLNSATPNERVNIYAQAGLWQNSVADLARLLSTHPNDANLKSDWQQLLTSEGVNLDQEVAGLANEPIISY
jgi:hypothetical protein